MTKRGWWYIQGLADLRADLRREQKRSQKRQVSLVGMNHPVAADGQALIDFREKIIAGIDAELTSTCGEEADARTD